MARVPLSPNCLKCQDVREGWEGCCSSQCEEGNRITKIFDLCHRGHLDCRHIEACTSDPRECGYWTDLTYPIEL